MKGALIADSPIPQDLRRPGFFLESGDRLPELTLRYEVYGRPSASPPLLVFHALTGSAHLGGCYSPEVFAKLSPMEQAFGPRGWWEGMLGPGRPFDPERGLILCANHLGSCYGSSGPCSLDARGQPLGERFPELTIRDLARAQLELLEGLGIDRVIAVGGSLGGMVALEFALLFPERVAGLIVIAAPARHGPWARAFNHLARLAIDAEGPRGLAHARALAMLSYRSPASFELRFAHDPAQVEAYLEHQGAKFLRRFDHQSYLKLSRAMDRHDVGRGRGGIPQALKALRQIPSLFVGVDSDLLYPPEEVRALAQEAQGDYRELKSPYGHDAFLLETEQLTGLLQPFLEALW